MQMIKTTIDITHSNRFPSGKVLDIARTSKTHKKQMSESANFLANIMLKEKLKKKEDTHKMS